MKGCGGFQILGTEQLKKRGKVRRCACVIAWPVKLWHPYY